MFDKRAGVHSGGLSKKHNGTVTWTTIGFSNRAISLGFPPDWKIVLLRSIAETEVDVVAFRGGRRCFDFHSRVRARVHLAIAMFCGCRRLWKQPRYSCDLQQMLKGGREQLQNHLTTLCIVKRNHKNNQEYCHCLVMENQMQINCRLPWNDQLEFDSLPRLLWSPPLFFGIRFRYQECSFVISRFVTLLT